MNHCRFLFVPCVSILLLVACADDDNGGGGGDCDPPCQSGFVCNKATKTCEPVKDCDPPCQAPQVCNPSTGKCEDPTCDPPCGANAICSGGCQCESGYYDCNADLGQTGGDGCECDKPCAQCGKTQCEESVKGSCGDETKYCEGGSCKDCPTDTRNCDGDNANKCEVQGTTCSSSSGMADDQCPATTPAVTQDTTITSKTSKQPIEKHCMLAAKPYSQVVAIQLSAKKKLTFAVEASGAEIVLSLRTQCTIDHGCKIDKDTITAEETVDAGTYNLVIATDKPTAYTLTIQFTNP